MNADIKRAILDGKLILFLGAGASRSSKMKRGGNVPDGKHLAQILAEKASLTYSDEALDQVYSAARSKMEGRLDEVLLDCFRFCTPSEEYKALTDYSWRRIYTLNLDDALERAFQRSHHQNVSIRLGSDPIENQDPFFNRLDLVKLNGCINHLRSGIVFSPLEYARSAAEEMPWYEEVAVDFLQCPFLFVGTKLSEPLFKYHIERYKQIVGRKQGVSFVITPNASDIEKYDLATFNIVHIAGTLDDFVKWLKEEIPQPPLPLQMAIANYPQLGAMLSSANQLAYANLFEGVMQVNRTNIATLKSSGESKDSIRTFYKGFKPTWTDISEGVPAELDALDGLVEFISNTAITGKITPIIGPSGSGKTTLLMQASYKISDHKETAVFYINEPIDDLEKTLEAIDNTPQTSRCIVAINDLDAFAQALESSMSSERLKKTIILGTVRSAIWNQRTKHKLRGLFTTPFVVDEFSLHDAQKLLAKLERYGQWTRLGQMKEQQRIDELVTRAKRQLLIALLEATSGRGFEEIITDEYNSLKSDSERKLFLLVGLATVHRRDMPVALVERALIKGGLRSDMNGLLNNLTGIVIKTDSGLAVRHSTYIRFLFSHVVDKSIISQVIEMLLQAFSLYQSPVVKHAPKREMAIYKAIVNHKFLNDVLKGDESIISGLYTAIEKRFEQDGLFWLQYGLSLRDFGHHAEALEKLRVAVIAHPMEHTEHALAQQLIIVAGICGDRVRALGLLDEAKTILEKLDQIIDSDDTYPLVTLAEGHTSIIRKYDGDDDAREIAKKYAELLHRKIQRFSDEPRLKESWESMFKYATTGTWAVSKEQ